MCLFLPSLAGVPVVSSTGGIPPNHPSLPLGPGGKGGYPPPPSSAALHLPLLFPAAFAISPFMGVLSPSSSDSSSK